MAVARAAMQLGAKKQRRRFSGSDYAEGGPRDARCSEKESSGEAFSGRTVCQATCRASGIRSRGATSRLAHCSSGECFTARFFLATSRVSRSSLRVITSAKSPSLFLRAELHRCSGDRHFFWRLLSTLSVHPFAGTEEK